MNPNYSADYEDKVYYKAIVLVRESTGSKLRLKLPAPLLHQNVPAFIDEFFRGWHFVGAVQA